MNISMNYYLEKYFLNVEYKFEFINFLKEILNFPIGGAKNKFIS
jgi:hypothetical protein